MFRGHEIIKQASGKWVFADTGESVQETYKHRPCGHCGLPNTPEGHDGCIGTLPGVRNACCGHGEPESAYVQRVDGSLVRGQQAVEDIATRMAGRATP